MRQQTGAELDFVSLKNTATSTEITINASSLAYGSYEIVLESFDLANTVQSALKTDRISLSVIVI